MFPTSLSNIKAWQMISEGQKTTILVERQLGSRRHIAGHLHKALRFTIMVTIHCPKNTHTVKASLALP